MQENQKIGERIREIRKKLGLTQTDLGKKLNVAKATISDWESGKREFSTSMLRPIAAALDVDIWDLIAWDSVVIDDRTSMAESRAIRIPVLGTIPAGIPLEAIEEVLDWEEIPRDWTRGGKEYFALRITGNSMEPDYRDGDVLIIRRQDDCESGDDCAVMVNGDDATFKRVRKSERGVSLTPLNPAYETLFYTNEEANELPVRILGVVVELRRQMRRTN